MSSGRRRSLKPDVLVPLFVLSASAAGTLDAQDAATAPRAPTGAAIYQAACAACHGPDGRGAPPSLVGFERPLPDFTDCAFATPEPDLDWLAVAHDGGPARGFDRRMPAFGAALSEAELKLALGHIRSFCTDRAWPRGELNLPRPFVTEKAFPENEVVLTTTVATRGPGAVSHELLYERRVGPRSQIELSVPVELARDPGGAWRRGLGDVAAAVKHAWFHDLDRGSIVSAAAEVIFPTGKAHEGLGSGVTILEPFLAAGQLLPRDAFLQAQAGLELPLDREGIAKEALLRLAAGKSFVQGRFGRTWTPMVELVGARELVRGETWAWDVVPQMQVTLSRRQHVMLNVGARVPVIEREGRAAHVMAYFLWDWFDGGLFEGWR